MLTQLEQANLVDGSLSDSQKGQQDRSMGLDGTNRDHSSLLHAAAFMRWCRLGALSHKNLLSRIPEFEHQDFHFDVE